MAKNLQLTAQEELRYLSYIESVDAKRVSLLSANQQEKIKKKAGANKGMAEVEHNFQLQMKKCVVLKEMLIQGNDEKFLQLRINKRRKDNYVPFFGTIKGIIS